MPSPTHVDFILPAELLFEVKIRVSRSFWAHIIPAPQLERKRLSLALPALTRRRRNFVHDHTQTNHMTRKWSTVIGSASSPPPITGPGYGGRAWSAESPLEPGKRAGLIFRPVPLKAWSRGNEDQGQDVSHQDVHQDGASFTEEILIPKKKKSQSD